VWEVEEDNAIVQLV